MRQPRSSAATVVSSSNDRTLNCHGRHFAARFIVHLWRKLGVTFCGVGCQPAKQLGRLEAYPTFISRSEMTTLVQ
jgi:hypothetical protein